MLMEMKQLTSTLEEALSAGDYTASATFLTALGLKVTKLQSYNTMQIAKKQSYDK